MTRVVVVLCLGLLALAVPTAHGHVVVFDLPGLCGAYASSSVSGRGVTPASISRAVEVATGLDPTTITAATVVLRGTGRAGAIYRRSPFFRGANLPLYAEFDTAITDPADAGLTGASPDPAGEALGWFTLQNTDLGPFQPVGAAVAGAPAAAGPFTPRITVDLAATLPAGFVLLTPATAKITRAQLVVTVADAPQVGVPEPSTLALLLAGPGLLLLRRRR